MSQYFVTNQPTMSPQQLPIETLIPKQNYTTITKGHQMKPSLPQSKPIGIKREGGEFLSGSYQDDSTEREVDLKLRNMPPKVTFVILDVKMYFNHLNI